MAQDVQNGMIIGLTGQTGAGKSTVGNMIARHGFCVIDADAVAREVVEIGEKCLRDLAAEFGADILNADGSLDRKRLAGIAFSDNEKRVRLNSITHPYILERIMEKSRELFKKGAPAVFWDAPTLFESGGDALCCKVVGVTAPVEERVLRVMKRDGIKKSEALARVGAQHGDGFYTARSDFVIENAADLPALGALIAEMLKQFGLISGGDAP